LQTVEPTLNNLNILVQKGLKYTTPILINRQIRLFKQEYSYRYLVFSILDTNIQSWTMAAVPILIYLCVHICIIWYVQKTYKQKKRERNN